MTLTRSLAPGTVLEPVSHTHILYYLSRYLLHRAWSLTQITVDTHAIMSSPTFAEHKPFSQAILMSGVSSVFLRTYAHHQNTYDRITNHLKLQDKTGAEKLAALRALSGDEMCAAYNALGGPMGTWNACIDGYFLVDPEALHIENLPKRKYDASIKRVLLGDTEDEGLIAAPILLARKNTYETVRELAIKHLGPVDGPDVLEAYGISSTIAPGPLFQSLVKVISDATWSQPIEAFAKSFSSGDVFYYHVAEVNPFEGPAKGKSHHGVDLLFSFMNYQKHLSPELAKQAEVFSSHWIDFVVGKNPWKPYAQKPDGEVTMLGYGHEGQHGEFLETVKAGYTRLRLAEKLQPRIAAFAGGLRGEVLIE